jgi:uncharacterized protein YndB with AHSA1/START domain
MILGFLRCQNKAETKMEKKVGQTKDVGFQIGVRKTFPVSIDIAWHFLFSEEGLKVWLGKVNLEEFQVNKTYKTEDGIEGKINVFRTNSHIRLTWKPNLWTNVSAVQVRVINAKGKTTISFHQDKLLDSKQREEMKKHWDRVLEEITAKLK